MSLNVADWVQVIAFGALLGAAGQIVRVVAGLKKLNEEASQKGLAVAQLFSTSQFVFSVLIGAVAGLLGALSLGINPKDMIATDKLISLLGVGYAGADFIEAFMAKHGAIAGDGGGTAVKGPGMGSSPAAGGQPPSAGIQPTPSAVDKGSLTTAGGGEAVG